MLSNRFRIIFVVLLLAGLILLFQMIRKRKLSIRYAMIWIIMMISLAVLVLIPGCLEWMANLLGIYDVTNMVFFLGFVFSIVLSFALTVSSSRNSERIRKLTQQMGLKEYEHRVSENSAEQESENEN